MSNQLGLNISLPSGTLSQLQATNNPSKELNNTTRRTNIQVNVDTNEQDYCDSSDVDDKIGLAKNDIIENDDQWDDYGNDLGIENAIHDRTGMGVGETEIMPFIHPDSCTDDNNNDDENDKYNESESNEDEYSQQSDNDSLDNISISPPISMPLLVVELDKLCGYVPSDEDEAKELKNELYQALLGIQMEETQVNDCNKNENDQRPEQNDKDLCYGDGLSLDFITRAVELLEAGMAHHSDTLQHDLMNVQERNNLNYVFVPYPEFLPISTNNIDENSETSIMATKKIWKRILKHHDIPVVNKLLELLSKCSRSLIWKHEMAMEIRRIVKEEKENFEDRKRRKELKIWRREKRPDELAKLYDVRETFQIKLEMLRTKHEGYVREREERVHRELLRRKEKGIGNGGVAALDYDGKITFAFDDVDEIVKNLLPDKSYSDEDYQSIESGYHDSADDDFGETYDDGYDCDNDEGYDCDNDDVYNDLHSHSENHLQHISNDSNLERRQRRVKAATKRLRRKLEVEKDKARAEELRQKVKAAHEEEALVRQMCISTDEKLAMVMVQNLEKRLERVDDLLDSLQNDVWNDEEEGLLDSDASDEDSVYENPSINNDESTLLHSILAMILGSIHHDTSISDQDHYTNLKQEHEAIVEDWKLAFGRLPKLHSDQPKPGRSKEYDADEYWSEHDYDDNIIDVTHHNPMKTMFGSALSVPDDWEETECEDLILPRVEEIIQDHNIGELAKLRAPQSNQSNDAAMRTMPRGLRPGSKLK